MRPTNKHHLSFILGWHVISRPSPYYFQLAPTTILLKLLDHPLLVEFTRCVPIKIPYCKACRSWHTTVKQTATTTTEPHISNTHSCPRPSNTSRPLSHRRNNMACQTTTPITNKCTPKLRQCTAQPSFLRKITSRTFSRHSKSQSRSGMIFGPASWYEHPNIYSQQLMSDIRYS